LRKIVDVGEGFVQTEEARVKKLISGKVSKTKKEELEERLNILHSFSGQTEGKDEL